MNIIEIKADIFDLNVSIDGNTQQINKLQTERSGLQLELLILQRHLQALLADKTQEQHKVIEEKTS